MVNDLVIQFDSPMPRAANVCHQPRPSGRRLDVFVMCSISNCRSEYFQISLASSADQAPFSNALDGFHETQMAEIQA